MVYLNNKISHMKIYIYLLLLFSSVCTSQNKYLTKTGSVIFEASVPSFEEVRANNSSVTAILNAENGEFASLVLIKGFRFKNALMEEHFNENYAESEKFPKSTFKGKINNFDLLSSQEDYTIDGELTFHGVQETMEKVPIKLFHENNIITLSGTFKTKASDFDIKIPKIVRNKISENVDVSFEFELRRK